MSLGHCLWNSKYCRIRYAPMLIAASAMLLGHGAHAQTTPATQSSDVPIWQAPPRKTLAPLTPELIENIKNRAPVQAEIRTLPNGAVQAFIDKKPSSLMMGVFGMATGTEENGFYDTYQKAGMNLALLFTNAGFYYAEDGYVSPLRQMRPFWTGKDQYYKKDLEVNLWRPLRANPDAKLLIWITIGPYPQWMTEHPDEIIRNEAGVPMLVTHHFQRFGDAPVRKPNAPTERFTPSFFSDIWLADVQAMVAEFIRAAEETVPGKSIAGYVIGGGQDAQLYPWNPPDFVVANNPQLRGDYSKPAIQAWRKWLRDKYASVDALSAAWKIKVASFDAAAAPPAQSLTGAPGFHDPATEQQQIDWNRFQAEGRARFHNALAKTIREASSRKTLVGVSGGESGSRRDLSTTMLLLEDPNIDIVFHQVTYNHRFPPNVGGLNAATDSHALHKKIFFADVDHPTWLHRPITSETIAAGISHGDMMRGRAQNIDQLQSMWRREFGRILATGSGAAMHRLNGGWGYEDETIVDELRVLHDVATTTPPPSATQPLAETVVIFDEQSLSYLRGKLPELHSRWATQFWNELNASGVPYRLYYSEDLAAGRVPPGKLYIFTNLLKVDAPLAAAIEKLKSQNRTLVFLQGTGYAGANASQLTGMKLEPIASADKLKSTATPASVDTTKIIGAEQPLDADPQVGLAVVDSAAIPLATYADGGKVAAAMVNRGAYRSIFIGGFHLTRNTVNALALHASAWRLTEPGCVATMHPDLLVLHPLTSGRWTITLPEARSLTAVAPETLTSPKSQQHTLTLEAGKSYMFRLSGKAAAR